MTSLLEAISNHLFGRKYYCVTLESGCDANGIGNRMLSSFIFTDKESANAFFMRMKYNNRTVAPIEIVSFRSREEYSTHSDCWNFNLNH